MINKSKYPKIFRFFYKSEMTFIFPTLFFIMIGIFYLYNKISFYYDFKNKYLEEIRLEKMKVISEGGGSRVGYSYAQGYVIGQNSKCKDCVSVAISSTSIFMNKQETYYFDPKYENIEIGDTISIWYTSKFDYAQIVVPNSKEGLVSFERKKLVNGIYFLIKLFLVVFIPYIVSRKLRKYYQKKYGITAEDYKQYVKIAYKK